MTQGEAITEQHEPDIVAVILRRVLETAPGFSMALSQQIEREVRAEFGGQRLFVPKGAFKRLTARQREAVFQDGTSPMSTAEIIAKHNISRATLYREMKKGGRFGGG